MQQKNRFVLHYTNKYLPRGSRVLEGGCGIGHNVNTLFNNGYDAYGVDFAKETVSKVKQAVPELNIATGDVRQLDFDNDYFDGYWSLGVIEHFVSGYEAILAEMYRVLRTGGYLFLTVPSMSPLRRAKARLGLYRANDNPMADRFYQYAFLPGRIIRDFTENNFKFILHRPTHGLKGLKDEIGLMQRSLQYIVDSQKSSSRVIGKFIDVSMRRVSNHASFFVFRKQGSRS